MVIKIRQRNFNKWPEHIRRRLWALSLKESGLKAWIRVYPNTKTFVMFENDTPVAWAAAFTDDPDGGCIMLYTRRNKRLKGYGRRLFKKARKYLRSTGNMCDVFKDGVNDEFFEKMGY